MPDLRDMRRLTLSPRCSELYIVDYLCYYLTKEQLLDRGELHRGTTPSRVGVREPLLKIYMRGVYRYAPVPYERDAARRPGG